MTLLHTKLQFCANCMETMFFAHLWHRQMRLSRQAQFLLLWRIRIEAMLVQPVPQNLNGLFGEVSTAAAFGGRPASLAAFGQVERETIVFAWVTVWHGRKLSVSIMTLLKSWEDEGNRTLLVSKYSSRWNERDLVQVSVPQMSTLFKACTFSICRRHSKFGQMHNTKRHCNTLELEIQVIFLHWTCKINTFISQRTENQVLIFRLNRPGQSFKSSQSVWLHSIYTSKDYWLWTAPLHSHLQHDPHKQREMRLIWCPVGLYRWANQALSADYYDNHCDQIEQTIQQEFLQIILNTTTTIHNIECSMLMLKHLHFNMWSQTYRTQNYSQGQ